MISINENSNHHLISNSKNLNNFCGRYNMKVLVVLGLEDE